MARPSAAREAPGQGSVRSERAAACRPTIVLDSTQRTRTVPFVLTTRRRDLAAPAAACLVARMQVQHWPRLFARAVGRGHSPGIPSLARAQAILWELRRTKLLDRSAAVIRQRSEEALSFRTLRVQQCIEIRRP